MELASKIDGPVAVIGDVHGQLDLLDQILIQLETLPDFENRWVVFIGDLVDRGADSAGVIQRILDLKRVHERTGCVMGNHELAMGFATGLLPAPDYTDWDTRWCDYYGADATFRSYSADFPDCDSLRNAIPAEHADFLACLPWAIDHPDYYFVHAGLDPNQSFDLQRRILEERDFSLARPPWLCSKDFANEKIPDDCTKTVISGHVPVQEVQVWKRRILVDTTGGVGGELSCVLLPELSLVTSQPAAPPAPKPAETRKQPISQPSPSPSRNQHGSHKRRSSSKPEHTEEIHPKWYEFWK